MQSFCIRAIIFLALISYVFALWQQKLIWKAENFGRYPCLLFANIRINKKSINYCRRINSTLSYQYSMDNTGNYACHLDC